MGSQKITPDKKVAVVHAIMPAAAAPLVEVALVQTGTCDQDKVSGVMLLVSAKATLSMHIPSKGIKFCFPPSESEHSMEILVTSQVLPSSGTTVQSKSAAVDEELPVIVLPSWQLKPPSVGILKVQVHAARMGARPENSWTATAPNPAASTFDIMAMSGMARRRADLMSQWATFQPEECQILKTKNMPCH